MNPLTLTPLSNIPLIRQGYNLADIILNSLQDSNIALQDNDIFVIAQKVVSKAEGCAVNLATITPSIRAMEIAQQIEKDPRFVELILQESNAVLRTRPGTIIVEHRLGFVCANAGIDHSNVNSPLLAEHPDKGAEEEGLEVNVEEWVLLLPKDPDASSKKIRGEIESKAKRKVGIAIIDSHGRAWRNGTVGVAIGMSGVPGLVDLRGKNDLFGYSLRITMVGAADELAAAASLVMGQAAEGTPVVHVRGFPYPLREGSIKELLRPKEQDLFR